MEQKVTLDCLKRKVGRLLQPGGQGQRKPESGKGESGTKLKNFVPLFLVQ